MSSLCTLLSLSMRGALSIYYVWFLACETTGCARAQAHVQHVYLYSLPHPLPTTCIVWNR